MNRQSHAAEPGDRAGGPPASRVEGSDAPTDRALDLTPTTASASVSPHHGAPSHDPLRLCIFATVALIAWIGGPFALAFFAGLGLVGYAKARRGGLLRSACLLGDTRVVLAYLGVLLLVAGGGIYRVLTA